MSVRLARFLALLTVLVLTAATAQAQVFTCSPGVPATRTTVNAIFKTTFVASSNPGSPTPIAGVSTPSLFQTALVSGGSFDSIQAPVLQFPITAFSGRTIKFVELLVKPSSVSRSSISVVLAAYGPTGAGSPQPNAANDAQLLAGWTGAAAWTTRLIPVTTVELALQTGQNGINTLQALANQGQPYLSAWILPTNTPSIADYRIRYTHVKLRVEHCA